MKKGKFLKMGLFAIAIGVVIVGIIVSYLFFMPHRDVQATTTDFVVSVSDIVNEYLTDPAQANAKYLDEEGESRILEVSGLVAAVTEDFNQQKVVLLRSADSKAGVSCTFTQTTNDQTNQLTVGQAIAVKGVIRSGAAYDKDLEMYEDVILEKCALIQ